MVEIQESTIGRKYLRVHSKTKSARETAYEDGKAQRWKRARGKLFWNEKVYENEKGKSFARVKENSDTNFQVFFSFSQSLEMCVGYEHCSFEKLSEVNRA